MTRWLTILTRATVSATAAAATSTLALALLAKSEGAGALQPLNATSHWLHGSGAARLHRADLTHTGVGYATHHAATFFWALLFEGRFGTERPLCIAALIGDAVAISVVAAAVDYLATPRRFTPGWEFVLSKRSMAVTYAAMAAGLAIGVGVMDRAEARQVG